MNGLSDLFLEMAENGMFAKANESASPKGI